MKFLFPQTLLWEKGQIFGKHNRFLRLLINLMCEYTSQIFFWCSTINQELTHLPVLSQDFDEIEHVESEQHD